MTELLWIKPIFKEMIWGGSRLKTIFNYEIPGEHTGECWAISAHTSGDCTIASGTYAGETLSGLWDKHPELFRNDKGGDFPLLVKIIDAKQDLSIQVHPDDNYARLHENGSLGKTECWYVLDCDENATIVIGHHAKNYEEMEQMILEKRWSEFIREIPVKKGDFFQIEPGCLHAIKGGTLILETQQSSDVTYRVYDYDRLSDGKPRQLHVQQSIDTIRAPFIDTPVLPEEISLEGATVTHYVTCPYYSVDLYRINGSFSHDFQTAFTNVSIIDGEGSIDGTPFEKGSHFIIPHGYGSCQFEGQFTMICSAP